MLRRCLLFTAISVAVFATVCLLLFGYGYAWRRYTYPYGWSHSCLSQLAVALRAYAELNEGCFPAGGACPEASLSLLDRGHNGVYAEMLCGKTKSAQTAKTILQRGELLGPDTCDWHYVEGLTLADDARIAVVWDKIGLGHNGERLSKGGHTICRLDSTEDVIPESDWPEFLREQERLMAARTEAAKKGLPALTAEVRLPTGELVDHYNAPYELDEIFRGSSHQSGESLPASCLRWWQLSDSGTMTLTLTLGKWKSKPVAVQISDGKATPSSVIFEMQAEKAP
jgi:hypothetical protein